MEDERRDSKRFPADKKIKIKFFSNEKGFLEYEAKVVNISSSGVFIVPEEKIPDDVENIYIESFDKKDTGAKIKRVSEEKGYGLKFKEKLTDLGMAYFFSSENDNSKAIEDFLKKYNIENGLSFEELRYFFMIRDRTENEVFKNFMLHYFSNLVNLRKKLSKRDKEALLKKGIDSNVSYSIDMLNFMLRIVSFDTLKTININNGMLFFNTETVKEKWFPIRVIEPFIGFKDIRKFIIEAYEKYNKSGLELSKNRKGSFEIFTEELPSLKITLFYDLKNVNVYSSENMRLLKNEENFKSIVSDNFLITIERR